MNGIEACSDGGGDPLRPSGIQHNPDREVFKFTPHTIGGEAENGDDFCGADFEGLDRYASQKTPVFELKQLLWETEAG